MGSTPEVSLSARLWSAIARRPDPLTSIAFTVPVFLVYHLGILLVDRRSQVDFISSYVLRMLNASVPAYVLGTLALTLLLLVVVWIEHRRKQTQMPSAFRVGFEAAAAAALLLTALGWTTHRLLRTHSTESVAALGVSDKLVLAAGSGFHAELLFRVLCVSGGAWVLRKLFGLKPSSALLWAVALASLGNALLASFGVPGEPFYWDAFGLHVLEGCAFALLYLTRGFAVAVYAHVIYDALVYFMYASG
jgi:hypothetical protein